MGSLYGIILLLVSLILVFYKFEYPVYRQPKLWSSARFCRELQCDHIIPSKDLNYFALPLHAFAPYPPVQSHPRQISLNYDHSLLALVTAHLDFKMIVPSTVTASDQPHEVIDKKLSSFLESSFQLIIPLVHSQPLINSS